MYLSTPKRKNGIHFEVSMCINNKTFEIYINIKFATKYVAYADCMAATLISLMASSMMAAYDPWNEILSFAWSRSPCMADWQ